MVNTRTDTDLSAVVQNALQAMFPRIREEIREEFRTGSGSSNAGGNPTPVTIHMWLERFNKQKPHSFEKATVPVDAENWISHMAYKKAKGGDAWLVTVTWADFKKLLFLQFFLRAEQERLKREYHSIRSSGLQRFFCCAMFIYSFYLCYSLSLYLFTERYAQPYFFSCLIRQFFPRAEQERLKREYHSIRQTNTETSKEFMQCFLRLAGSTLNHLMCMLYTDVAQVDNVARNYEILHERDDDDAERPDKWQKSGDRHQPTTQQSSHRNHSHNNDRHGSDRRGGGIPVMGVTRETGVSSSTDMPILVPSSPRHPGECHRAAGTCFKCGQAGHLQKDCKKNTTASTSGHADKKPGASGRVFAITEDHATKTS
nr:hypothetical protein [Tanacetum cinerariifolium]